MDALGRGADRVANGDREAVEQGARRAGALDRGTHLYPLAFGEAARRQEARAIAVRVREQATCVATRARAGDADVRELARRDAEEADLRLGRGVATPRKRRDRNRAAGSGRRDIQLRRRACRRRGR